MTWELFFQNHGTKLLGLAQGTVALIAGATDLLSPTAIKWCLLVSSILTYWRGVYNSDQQETKR